MQEQEFLQNYEIGRWEFSPRIYKILGLSVVIVAVTVLGLGRTNLLHAKACDSHYIGKVCQVLDTIYVGSKMFSGDTDYVVKDYNKTSIKDSDVIWVDQTGEGPKFTYPEGYFYKEPLSDPLDPNSSIGDSIIPPSSNSPIEIIPPPSNNDSGLIGRRQNLPKKNPKPVSGDLPDSIIGSKSDKDDKNKPDETDNQTADKDKTDGKDPGKKDPVEENSAKNNDPVKGLDINKKPLLDFADEVLVKWETKKVDLSQQFRVKLVGALTENGRLDPKKTRYTEAIGDEGMIEVAKRAIESVGDSGWLDYLGRFDVKTMNIVFAQNDSQLVAVVDSDLPSAEKANTAASGLRGIIQAALLLHSNGIKKLKDDEVVLLKAANITSEGKKLKINFNLAKPTAQQMIDSRLKEYQADKLKKKDQDSTQPKPNGTADLSSGKRNAA
ncbi:MAG: hypothetical protein KDB79_13095 [Acidobacteria bacterium]|nr:hypothetical protein [Acidobacteriota bacterium]